MAEEVKATKKTSEKEKAEKTFTREEVQKMVTEAVAQAVAEVQAKQPQAIVLTPKDETVSLVYIGTKSEGTKVNLHGLGRIYRAGTILTVPKKDFIRNLGSETIDELLRKRSLIVLDGLDEDERKRYGLDYKKGEVLTIDAFFSLLDYSTEEIVKIFEAACKEHKQVIATTFLDAYFEKHDNRISLERAKALNEASKKDFPQGLFTPMLRAMTEEIAQ